MSEENLARYFDNTVHEETQAEGSGFDLTLGDVYIVIQPGKVDFGGGELEESQLMPRETEMENPNDDYSWWALDGGQYLIEYNETPNERFDKESPELIVETRKEVLRRGAYHPSVDVEMISDALPLSVPDGGIRLKENARISTVKRI
ncbi:MAG: dCTP deaminase [Halobacteria archaeon]